VWLDGAVWANCSPRPKFPDHRRKDLGTNAGAYPLRARLNVSLPGLEREVAQALVDGADQTCPYSKATRGNIDVTFNPV